MTLTQLTRSTFTILAGLGIAFGLASCEGDSLDNPGLTAGAFNAGGASAGARPGPNTVAGASVGGGNGPGSGGSVAGSGFGTGGSASGSGNNGSVAGSGSGGAPSVCTDNPAPSDNPDWEGTCDQWKNEASACEEPWFKQGNYCNRTCGRCSSGAGGTGNNNGGTGNNNNGGTGNNNGGTGNNNGPTLPNLTSGPEYHASRYWDCCKTHCATNAGARACGKDGVSQNNGTSSCNNGSAYACYSEAPRAISSTVSYGYIAKPNPNCGTCYHIQFTGQGHYAASDPGSVAIAGKHMIVKVSNTGSDVNQDQFDLMIPGGGVGQFQQGCRNQWGDNIEMGATYGGFYSQDPKQKLMCNTGTQAQRKACVKELCNQLPAGDARDGCTWWVDWLELADNPKFRWKEIQCPSDI